MLVITGKRIKIILACIFIAMFAFSFQIATSQKEAHINTQNTIPTTATPVSGKTIVVDAGHGVPEKGGSLLH